MIKAARDSDSTPESATQELSSEGWPYLSQLGSVRWHRRQQASRVATHAAQVSRERDGFNGKVHSARAV